MDCKEMILSEDTYDIITDFSASEFLGDDNNCYERIGEDFLILYLGNLGIRNPKIDFFPYHNMPKLYGLMQLSPSGETPPGAAPFDPASLIASGITQVQRPPLSLTGQGVILCFIDTGIDYQNPVFLGGLNMVLNTAERILTWRCAPRILILSFPPGTKTDTAVSSPESPPAVSSDKAILISVLHRVPTSSW